MLEMLVSNETLNHFFVHLPFSIAFETRFFELYGFELGWPMFLMEWNQLSGKKQQLSTQKPSYRTYKCDNLDVFQKTDL